MEADGLEGVVGTIMDHHMDHQTAHRLGGFGIKTLYPIFIYYCTCVGILIFHCVFFSASWHLLINRLLHRLLPTKKQRRDRK